MGCVNCKKIRDAVLHGKMAEAAGLTVEVLREKMGFAAAPDEPETDRVVLGKVAVVGEQSPETIIPAQGKSK